MKAPAKNVQAIRREAANMRGCSPGSRSQLERAQKVRALYHSSWDYPIEALKDLLEAGRVLARASRTH
jgi:hypothetical protein